MSSVPNSASIPRNTARRGGVPATSAEVLLPVDRLREAGIDAKSFTLQERLEMEQMIAMTTVSALTNGARIYRGAKL